MFPRNKINDIIEIDNNKFKVVEDLNNTGCNDCYFNQNNIDCLKYNKYIGICSACFRDDNKSIIFVKLD